MSNQAVALVTGATSGIGAYAAEAYAKNNYQVVLSGRRKEKGQELVEKINAAGGNAHFIQSDVSDIDQTKALVEETVKTFGQLNTAFNNAGIEGDIFVPTHEQSVENYRTVFDINVLGVLHSMKFQIPAMMESGGSIVNNASIAGLIGFQGMSVYTASKHAVIGLTKTAALEYAEAKIRINAVAPGPIETEMFERFANDEVKDAINAQVPLGRAGSPDEIASAVLWLSDPNNSYTTGQVIAVDGGYTTH